MNNIRPEVAEAKVLSLGTRSGPDGLLDGDTKPEEAHVENAAPVTGSLEDDEKTGRRIVRKLDLLIIPVTALLYLATSLNRSNIGNAKLQGLNAILGKNTSNNYAIAVSAFYIAYIVFNIPGNILVTHADPQYVMGTGAVIWGASSTAQAGAKNFAGLIVCRLLIGLGEASFGVAVSVYYAIWYKRDEVATRLSCYIGMGSLAGAFSGLIAYGVSFIHSDKLANYKILFLIEGTPTIILGVITFFFLPSTPDKSHFLKGPEREVLLRRLHDTGFNRRHSFDRSAFRRVLSLPSTYMLAFLYMSHNLSLGSISGFFPTIIQSMGYTAAEAQLYTVPPYAVSFVVTIAIALFSDRFKTRGIPCASLLFLNALGFAILLAVPKNNAVRYFATFPALVGAFGNGPLILGWGVNTAGSHSAGAVRLGVMAAIGQTMAVLASYVFPAAEGPQYYTGFSLNLAFAAVAMFVALYLTWFYRRENARRDREEGVVGVSGVVDVDRELVKPTAIEPDYSGPALHDRTPGFRYYV